MEEKKSQVSKSRQKVSTQKHSKFKCLKGSKEFCCRKPLHLSIVHEERKA
jgi:hypothetical protein